MPLRNRSLMADTQLFVNDGFAFLSRSFRGWMSPIMLVCLPPPQNAADDDSLSHDRPMVPQI